MSPHHRYLCVALAGVLLVSSSPRAASGLAPDDEIRKILVDRIDVQKQGVGIVIGVIEPGGRRIVTYGRRAKDDTGALDGDTVFEIGSVTKVFTSLLLADAVGRGEVALTDPVAKFLPPKVKMPERGGRVITLQDLSMHMSGLARMPTNFSPKDQANPYADYTVDQLYQFLSGYQLTRDIGERYEYSNLGGGLLGHVLTLRTRLDYDAMVRARIARPLNMASTAIALSPDMKARLAAGHNRALQRVPNWDLPTLAGAGALRSSTNDLLTFLAAHLGYIDSPLAPAMARMLSVRKPTSVPDMAIALGWHVFTAHGKTIVWHNGGTGGYRTFIGFDPQARVGVVALSNVSTEAGVDDIGRHLLDSEVPLVQLPAPATHTATAVEASTLDQYVGRYKFAPATIMTISRDGEHLMAQLTGQPKVEIYPEGEHEFFLQVVDAQITFEVNERGRATALVLHQLGRDQRATKIDGEPPLNNAPKEITMASDVFDRLVGEYEFGPTAVMTISREGTHFYEQLSGQDKFEIFAMGEREYFLKVVDARITFDVDSQMRTTALVLHQAGREVRATRVP